tara:strand:+ start:2577 stop:3227 length:651 start_codon:yes stop_codon:yes gene_type:complete
MAGDWIKVECVTPNKPEVSKVSRLLKITKDDAFGKMMRFWMWIDSNSVDGHVDGVVSHDIDDLVACVGFSTALVEVNWLKINDEKERITIPNFDRHNGKTAKNRALKNKRQSKWRSQSVDSEESTNASTREEKRREDIKESKKKKFIKPTYEEVKAYCDERKNEINPQNFIDSNEQKGWLVGKTRTPMKDWKAAIRTWEQNRKPEAIDHNPAKGAI